MKNGQSKGKLPLIFIYLAVIGSGPSTMARAGASISGTIIV
jgi:hypothetical protein